jgi:hypothetical protein
MQARPESDVSRLEAKFESGALVRPAREAPNLVDLASAWWTACGVDGIALTPAAEDTAQRIGPAEHLLCVIADGLGLEMLEAMPAASFLWQHLAGALRTVYPSTTATALTSFYTAAWPAEHAITGQWLQLPPPAGSATVLPFTTRYDSRPLDGLGVSVEQVFPLPSLFSRVARDRLLLLPEGITRSRFTEYVAGGARIGGYRSLAEAFEMATAVVERADGPTCCLLYTPRIDDVAHEHGPAHLEVVGAVRALDAQMALIARVLGPRVRIVLTADHGHLPMPRTGPAIVRSDDQLGPALSAPPSGDVRMAAFHFRPDADRAAFAGAFRARFAEQFALLTADEVDTLRLLGPLPLSPLARERLGDFVAVALGADVMLYRAGPRSERGPALRSHHSGLSSAEMRVPFVLV